MPLQLTKNCDTVSDNCFENQNSNENSDVKCEIISSTIPINQNLPLQDISKNCDDENKIPREFNFSNNSSIVKIVILTDPNGHETCFVGEKDFDRLADMNFNVEEENYHPQI